MNNNIINIEDYDAVFFVGIGKSDDENSFSVQSNVSGGIGKEGWARLVIHIDKARDQIVRACGGAKLEALIEAMKLMDQLGGT